MSSFRRRTLALALFAWPADQRAREGEVLLDLALDLSEEHGTAREALGLLGAGLRARLGGGWTARRWIAAAALGAVVTTGGAVAAAGHHEVEVETETPAATAGR